MTIQTAASVRTRTRVTPGAAGPAAVQPGATADWMQSGGAAIEAYGRDRERVEARRELNALQREMPYRFFLKPGEEADIIILDADLGPGLLEHNLTNNPVFKKINPQTGYPRDQFITSCAQFEPDPLKVEYGLEPYFVTFVTVIDMRAGTNKRGQPYQNVKKLLPLRGDAMDMLAKIRQQRLAAGAPAHAPLRGLHLLMRRGSDQRSLRTGLPMFVNHYDDATVMQTFAHPEVRNEQGAVIKTANADCFAVDYGHLFPKPGAEGICRLLNIPMPSAMGSTGSVQQQWDRPANTAVGGGISLAAGGGGVAPAAGGGIQMAAGGVVGADNEHSWSQPIVGEGEASGEFAAVDLDDEIPF